MDTVQGFKVRNDGEGVQLTFAGITGNRTVTLSVDEAINLEQLLVKSVVVARSNTATVSDLPKDFAEPPEVILVERMEVQDMSDGSLNFQVQTRDGRHVQIAFHDHHALFLQKAFADMSKKKPY
jgi:hypothetical protein